MTISKYLMFVREIEGSRRIRPHGPMYSGRSLNCYVGGTTIVDGRQQLRTSETHLFFLLILDSGLSINDYFRRLYIISLQLT